MNPLPSTTPLFFCLRVPEFAAQALIRLRPALSRSAVAVLQGEPPLEKVCAATLQARRLGLRHGMTRTETESFPNLTTLRRSPTEEDSATATLLEMAARFTPRIEPFPRTSAFTLALDMTGTGRLFGSPHAVGQKLLRAARDLGFTVRLAASQNLHTAACLVRAPQSDTLRIVPPGEERASLHNLPLAALGLTPELADTFHAWGLRSAGELAALPAADVVSRLGEAGHRLLRLARGEHPHLFVPAEPTFSLQEHLAFDTPVDNLESLLFLLAPMLDQLIHRARTRALLLASLTVGLHLERTADAADHDRNAPPVISTGADSLIVCAAPGAPSSPTASPSVRVGSPLSHQTTPKPTQDPNPNPVISTGADSLIVCAAPGAPSSPTASPSVRVGSLSHQTTPKPTQDPNPNPVISTGADSLIVCAAERPASAPAHARVAPNPTHNRTLKPALPLDDRTLLLKLIQLDLQANPAPASIVAITLTAEPGPRPGVQSGLFSPQLPEPLRLEVTLARITALVGEGRVGRAVLADSHKPAAFHMERLTFEDNTARRKPKPAEPPRTGVALRRLRPPKPIQVWRNNGQLQAFSFKEPMNGSTLYTVQRAFGPWRQSGHWWSGEAWSREEWDIDATSKDGTQLLCLLTHDLLKTQWQINAFYD